MSVRSISGFSASADCSASRSELHLMIMPCVKNETMKITYHLEKNDMT